MAAGLRGKWHCQVACSLILVLLVDVRAYPPQCTLPAALAPGPLRPSVSPQFTVCVEAVMVDQNRTLDFLEYYDYANNRGRLTQTASGHVTDYFYDYATNELFIVNPETYECEVQPLSASPYTILLGDTPQGHIFSPAAALRFGQNGSREEYMGRTTIRGIVVNQWRACLNWSQYNATMTVLWSFVDTDIWQASASAMSIPVECHVTGRIYINDNTYKDFEHRYQFVNFIEGLQPESDNVFETPSQVVCPGRRNTKAFPIMPDAMSFVSESLDEDSKSVTYTTELYDIIGRVAIFVFRGATVFSLKYGLNPLIVVHDFNTGTEYVVDQLRGNCSMSGLTTTPDEGHVTADAALLRINSAKELLYMTGNYTYQGVKTIRGMPCDVWATQFTSPDLLGVSVNATREWAFSTWDWTTEDSITAMFISGVPVQMTTTLDDFGSRQTVVTNVYDYVASQPDVPSYVNLDPCFAGMPRNKVTLSISRVYKSLLEYFETRFKYAVRQNIATAISVSPLRVANIQYSVQDTSLDITFDLLPVPRINSQVDSPREELSLDNATRLLTEAVGNNKMVFQMQDGSNMPVYIAVDPTSVRVTPVSLGEGQAPSGRPSGPTSESLATRSNPAATTPAGQIASTVVSNQDYLCQQDDDVRYSAGEVAGCAVSVGALGGLLGGLAHRLVLRYAS